MIDLVPFRSNLKLRNNQVAMLTAYFEPANILVTSRQRRADNPSLFFAAGFDDRLAAHFAQFPVRSDNPMGNVEYFANKVKAARKAIQERTATRAKFQPATVVRADQGIRVDLGRSITMELLTSSNEDTYGVIKGTLQPGENVPLHSHNEAETSTCSRVKLKSLYKPNTGWSGK
jgi:hypothetical protein